MSATLTHTDVLVVGGGAAGTTAALVLARARHRVLLADDHTYRNRAVAEFHGFPTRDRTSPGAFLTDAHAELATYGVGIVTEPVTTAQPDEHGASVRFADGREVRAACVVVATGVHDDLPPIPGLAERWGRSAFNCPFCDGWEHRDRPVAVIDAAPGADHLAELLRSWTSQVTVVAAADVAALDGPGCALDRVVLRDGTSIAAHAAFVKAPVVPRSGLARALGCAVDVDGYVLTDAHGRTHNPRVWAAGDVRRAPPAPHQVVLAAADGSTAAISIHKAFVARELADERARRPAAGRTGRAGRCSGRARDGARARRRRGSAPRRADGRGELARAPRRRPGHRARRDRRRGTGRLRVGRADAAPVVRP